VKKSLQTRDVKCVLN